MKYGQYFIPLPDGSVVKNPPANAGDVGLIPGLGRSPRVGNINPLQYSSLGNPTDRGALQAVVHGIAKRVGHSLATINKKQQSEMYRYVKLELWCPHPQNNNRMEKLAQ